MKVSELLVKYRTQIDDEDIVMTIIEWNIIHQAVIELEEKLEKVFDIDTKV